jgi:ABC-2 type transport system permease protein
MRNLYAIYRKEMRHYFVSPIAYVVIGAFLFISGYAFNIILKQVIEHAFAIEMQSMQFGAPPQFDVPIITMGSFFGFLPTLILIFTPVLTMGIFAEERKRGTMELLMTSPLTELDIVLGKYLAALSVFALMLLPTAGYFAFIFLHSEPMPPWRLLLVAYAAALLFGGALLALGTFISSLTESQIIAAVLTFVAFLFLFLVGFASDSTGGLGAVIHYAGITNHYEDFTKGVIDTSGLIYFFSFIILFVFLTVRSIDSMRWRRA